MSPARQRLRRSAAVLLTGSLIATGLVALQVTGASAAAPTCAAATSPGTINNADGTTSVVVVAATATVTIPVGVSEVRLDVCGAQGESVSGPAAGGTGGRSQGTLAVDVAAGRDLLVVAGNRSGSIGSGGQAPGAAGNGGGYSAVFNSADGTDPLLVGGGGGGAGTAAGGAGGGTAGTAGVAAPPAGGGGGGSQTAGGAGGDIDDSLGRDGQPGSAFRGGDGATTNDPQLTGGGGGGGGYFGGGGGATTVLGVGGGGGGGSGFVSSDRLSQASTTGGQRSGDGAVVLTYRNATRSCLVSSEAGTFNNADGTTSVVVLGSATATATITVPIGVSEVRLDVCGAKGEDAGPVAAGNGGRSTAVLANDPTAERTLFVLAGKRDGSVGGGGQAPGQAGNGGGFSGVFDDLALTQPLLVAGGGGGAATQSGGAGGGATGAPGGDAPLAPGGRGGTQSAGGEGGTAAAAANDGGDGTQYQGGAGGVSDSTDPSDPTVVGGGGGGGGFFGGGGGATTPAGLVGGGGGGGSGFAAQAVSNAVLASGLHTRNGVVVISFVNPDVPTATPTATIEPSPEEVATTEPSATPTATTEPSPTPAASTSASPSPSPSPASGGGGGGGGSETPTSPTPSPTVSPSVSPSASPSPSPSPSATPAKAAGRVHALTPSRILDTREGGDAARVRAGADRVVQVTGRGGVPATGVSSVILNVTVTLATERGDLQVYPSGQRPARRTSNLNFFAGETVPVQVQTGVSPDGKVSLSVNTGSAHVIVDVFGYYGDASDTVSGSSGYTALQPQRLLDTRTGNVRVQADSDRTVRVAGRLGVPTNATAVVLNTTVLGTPGNADLQVYPTGQKPAERTSNLNVRRGQTKANSVISALGDGGSVNLSISQNSAHVVLDVLGYYSPDSRGRFVPLTPSRIFDTRDVRAPIRAGEDRVVQVGGQGGVPAGAQAAVLSVTGTGASNPVDLQVFPTGNRPAQRTSTINFRPGEAVANVAMATLGANDSVTLSLSQGSATVILDAVGYITEE